MFLMPGSRARSKIKTDGTILETINANAAVTKATTIPWSGYTSIMIILDKITGTAATQLLMQYYANGVLANTSYVSGTVAVSLSGATPAFSAAATSTVAIEVSQLNLSGITGVLSGIGYIFNISDPSANKHAMFDTVALATTSFRSFSNGVWSGGTAPITGCLFAVVSGTWSGVIKIYGIV
jgi:hypothetical protein